MAALAKRAAILMAATIFPLAWSAQAAPGFYIGTGMGMVFPSQSGDVDDIDPEAGLSLELFHLGYNFTDRLGISMQYGAGVGMTDDFLGDNTAWGQDYATFSFRYTHDTGSDFQPYLEAGVGQYMYSIMGDDGDFLSDVEFGYRVAIGGQYYLGPFYIAPELSYHFAQYEEGEFDLDEYIFPGYPKEFDADFETRGDMIIIQMKIGYHWLRN